MNFFLGLVKASDSVSLMSARQHVSRTVSQARDKAQRLPRHEVYHLSLYDVSVKLSEQNSRQDRLQLNVCMK